MHGGVLLLVGSGVGGGSHNFFDRAAAMVIAAHRRRLGNTSCPALGRHAASVSHGVGEAEVGAERKNGGAPLPGTSNVRIGAPGTLRFKLWGALVLDALRLPTMTKVELRPERASGSS